MGTLQRNTLASGIAALLANSGSDILAAASAIGSNIRVRNDYHSRIRNVGRRRNYNKYAGKCKAMASKKHRHIHLTEFMQHWKPRYANG